MSYARRNFLWRLLAVALLLFVAAVFSLPVYSVDYTPPGRIPAVTRDDKALLARQARQAEAANRAAEERDRAREQEREQAIEDARCLPVLAAHRRLAPRSDQFPLRVIVDQRLSERSRATVRRAMERWNRETSLQVFAEYEGPPVATRFDPKVSGHVPTQCGVVWVVDNKTVAMPAHLAGEARTGRCGQTVVLDEPALIDDPSVAAHELGHVLGLRHNRRDARDLMFPVAGMQSFITRHDRCLVRGTVQPAS